MVRRRCEQMKKEFIASTDLPDYIRSEHAFMRVRVNQSSGASKAYDVSSEKMGFWESVLGRIPPLLRFFALTLLVGDTAGTVALGLLPEDRRWVGFLLLLALVGAELTFVAILVWKKPEVALAETVKELMEAKEFINSPAFNELIDMRIQQYLATQREADNDNDAAER